MTKSIATTCGTALLFVLAARTLSAQVSAAPPPPPLPASPAALASRSDSAAVVSVIERFHAAMTAGDSAAVMAMLAPDAVILESGGVETRAEYQSHHLTGDISYAKSMKSARGPIRVSVRGDVAWASSTSITTGESRGRQVNSAGAELMVLMRTAAGWRISAIHWSSRSQRPPT